MGRSRFLIWILLAACLSVCFALQGQKAPAGGEKHKIVFADHDVQIPMPAGWTVVPKDRTSHDESGKVVLEKPSYRLSIGYHTAHASGIIGGRFIETFTIPWLDTGQAWNCSSKLWRVPQPATRALMFFSLYLNTEDPDTRTECGVKKTLSLNNGTETYGAERWLGGYFSTDGGWFFESAGANCNESAEDKSYTLVSTTRFPEKLPARGDPRLKEVIRQAIEIVGSIQYNRCPPTTAPYDPLSSPWANPTEGTEIRPKT